MIRDNTQSTGKTMSQFPILGLCRRDPSLCFGVTDLYILLAIHF